MPTITMDFTGVNPTQPSSGLRRDHIPAGIRYDISVKEATFAPSRSGTPMWTFIWNVDGPQAMGAQLTEFYTVMKSDGTRNDLGMGQVLQILMALGLNVGQRQVNIPTERLVGLKCQAEVKDEMYTPENGTPQLQSRISQYFALAQAVAQAPAPQPPAPAPAPVAEQPLPAAPIPTTPTPPMPPEPVEQPGVATNLAVPAAAPVAAPVAVAPAAAQELAAEVDSLFQ